MRADLLEVIPQRAEHLDLPPAQPGGQDQRVHGAVARPLLAQRAERVGEPRRAIDHGGDSFRGILDLVAIQVHLLAIRLPDRDVNLSGDAEPEIPERRQRLDEGESLHGVETESEMLRAPRRDPDFQPILERFEMLDVERDFRRRRRLAVDADPGLRGDPAVEVLSTLPFAEMIGKRPRDRVLPRRDELFDDALRRLFVDGMLQTIEVEVEDQDLDGAGVLRGDRIDRTEALRERARERLLHPVGVAHSRKAEVERGIAAAEPVVDRDLVVAGHLGDLVEKGLQLRRRSVEKLAAGKAIEQRPDLPKGMGHRGRVRVFQEPALLLAQQRHVGGALRERALGEPPE